MNDQAPGLRVLSASDEPGPMATLELISRARESLAEARTLPDIRRVMEAASVAADAAQRAARLFNAERRAAEVVAAATAAANDAAAVRIEAQAKAGELLVQMREHGERVQRGRPEKRSHVATFVDGAGEPLTLGHLGVSRSESSRWQEVASVPAEVRAKYVEETKAAKGEVSTAGLLREARAAATGDGSISGAAADPPAASAKPDLVPALHRALAALPTYPPALVSELAEGDRQPFQRTVSRVALWMRYLTAELRKVTPTADLSRQREGVYELIWELRGAVGDPPVVQAEDLADQVHEDDLGHLLGAVRDLSAWLSDLEAELIPHGAGDEAEETQR